MAQARDEWRASQGELNPERLVFIDETGAATDMARRYGKARILGKMSSAEEQ